MLRSSIYKSGTRLKRADAEACYVTMTIDDVNTGKYTIFFSDSTIDTNKGTDEGFRMDTIVTFNNDSLVAESGALIQVILSATCKTSAFCNKGLSALFLFVITPILQKNSAFIPAIPFLHNLLCRNKEESQANQPLRCFIDSSEQECKSSLCFANLVDKPRQSCGDDGVNSDGKVQVTVTAIANSLTGLLDAELQTSYTCNVELCNSIETMNKVKEIVDIISYNL